MSIMIDKKQMYRLRKMLYGMSGKSYKKDGDNKAFIKYPKDCWGCTSCIKECPMHAISFYLGADIGGMGSKVHTEENGDILKWVIEKYDGTVSEIDIDRKESNKY